MQQGVDVADSVWVIAVLGHSPGVLTGLVWALCREGLDIVGIEVWTTTGGVARLEGDLRRPDDPWLALEGVVRPRRFPRPPPPGTLEEHPPPRGDALARAVRQRTCFATNVLRSATGDRLEDIRTLGDAEVLQEALYDRVEALTRDLPPEVQLVGSVAGGRKTMSAGLQAAFTMYAEPTARLVHVLVHPDIERPYPRLRAFRFPGDGSQEAWLADEDAPPPPPVGQQVQLTEIPFAPLRAWRYHFDQQRPPRWSEVRRLRQASAGVRGRLVFHERDEVWTLVALGDDDAVIYDLPLTKVVGCAMAAVVLTDGGRYDAMVEALEGHPVLRTHVPPPATGADEHERRRGAMRTAVGELRRVTQPLRSLGLSDLYYRKDGRGIVAPIAIVCTADDPSPS